MIHKSDKSSDVVYIGLKVKYRNWISTPRYLKKCWTDNVNSIHILIETIKPLTNTCGTELKTKHNAHTDTQPYILTIQE